jgi:hypothetical protein
MAQAGQKINPTNIGITPVKDADSAISGLLNAVYGWAGIICVIVIIIAAYIYTTSAGDASHIKRAKEAITYSIIGLVVIMMAFVITQFVIGRF